MRHYTLYRVTYWPLVAAARVVGLLYWHTGFPRLPVVDRLNTAASKGRKPVA